MGCPKGTPRLKHGRSTLQWQKCLNCGVDFRKIVAGGFCSKPCAFKFRVGPAKEDWKGGPVKSQARYHTKRRKAQREFIAAYKQKPCMDCGGTFPPICMDFDHRDQSTKKATISEMVSLKLTEENKAFILAEMEKCDLVCANCHRIRTQARDIARLEARLLD